VIFSPTPLDGAWLVDVDRHEDARGFFARTWCVSEFRERGLATQFVQASLSRNARGGTLRGMHWQIAPHEEAKLVRCGRGAIWDVIVDLRPGSATYLRHFGAELSADTARALYVPRGFAHGFVTLAADTDVVYQMSDLYTPDAARGARWNDSAFGIAWPVASPTMNERDAGWPDFVPARAP
jgi:dTDP-4-dehydrorhamnose 3,5-epimerase